MGFMPYVAIKNGVQALEQVILSPTIPIHQRQVKVSHPPEGSEAQKQERALHLIGAQEQADDAAL